MMTQNHNGGPVDHSTAMEAARILESAGWSVRIDTVTKGHHRCFLLLRKDEPGHAYLWSLDDGIYVCPGQLARVLAAHGESLRPMEDLLRSLLPNSY